MQVLKTCPSVGARDTQAPSFSPGFQAYLAMGVLICSLLLCKSSRLGSGEVTQL